MNPVDIPLGGLHNANSTVYAKVGKCSTLNDWVAWRGMYKQQQGLTSPGNNNLAAYIHGLSWYEDANNSNNSAVIIAAGNGLSSKAVSNFNATTVIEANQWSNGANGIRWPIVQFADHVLIGTQTEGLTWYYPAGYNGTFTGNAGVAAPGNAVSTANNGAGNLNGLYRYVVTFVNAQNHESGPGPASTTHTANNNAVDLSGIDTGPAGTQARKIYRTVNDGVLYLHVGSLNDNTTTVFADDTLDTSLGAEVDLEGSDVPPTDIRGLVVVGNRLYILDSASKIWASKIDTSTTLPNWEAFPSSLAQLPSAVGSDVVMNIFNIGNVLFGGTRKAIFSIQGDPYTGQRVDKIADVGLYSRWSWCYVDDTQRYLAFLTSDFRILLMQGDGSYEVLSEDIRKELEGIANPVTLDISLTSSPAMVYLPHLNQIWLSTSTTGVHNNEVYILDLEQRQWSHSANKFLNAIVYDSIRKRVWTSTNSLISYMDPNSSYLATGVIQTHPIQVKGKALQIGRIGLLCSSHPVVGNVPPILKVSYSLDNNATIWKTNWIELTEDVGGTEITSDGQPIIRFFGVHTTCDSITIKIETPDITPNQVGIEIYGIMLEADEVDKINSLQMKAERDER